MSTTERANRPFFRDMLPWVAGAFLLGIPIGIAMPPLLPLFIVCLAGWGLVKNRHPTPSSRRAGASAAGLTITTSIYVVIWIGGNVSR